MLLFLDDATRAELAAKDAKEAEKVTYDYAIVAAALALTAMAQQHGFANVLGGAKKWRSVGLEYLARQLSVRNELRGRLLAQAVDVDPLNDSARLALWHYRFRYEDQLPALQTYWELTEGVAEKSKSPRRPARSPICAGRRGSQPARRVKGTPRQPTRRRGKPSWTNWKAKVYQRRIR